MNLSRKYRNLRDMQHIQNKLLSQHFKIQIYFKRPGKKEYHVNYF